MYHTRNIPVKVRRILPSAQAKPPNAKVASSQAAHPFSQLYGAAANACSATLSGMDARRSPNFTGLPPTLRTAALSGMNARPLSQLYGVAADELQRCPIWHDCPSVLPTLRGCRRRIATLPYLAWMPSALPTLRGCRQCFARLPYLAWMPVRSSDFKGLPPHSQATGFAPAQAREAGRQRKPPARGCFSPRRRRIRTQFMMQGATLYCNSGSRVSNPARYRCAGQTDGFPTQCARHHGLRCSARYCFSPPDRLYTCRNPLPNSRFCAAFPVVPLLQ